ncbi:MAG TPA: hypothetical protein VFY75_10480 [Solirubrobacterales bacterium]|nr:hypothetical protein [Solirubrobacterales bacterium]
MTRTKKKSLTAAATLFAAAVAFAGLGPMVGAEIAQKDGVRVTIDGTLEPNKLPRKGTAPVSVSIDSRISTAKKGELPKLEGISIAINSQGRVNNRRVPLCRLGRIDPSTTAEALAACRSSLIGEGRFTADVRIPEQSPFPSRGKLLAFNGRLRGKPAIFAHIYGTKPVPTSYVLPFLLSKTKGTFGTLLRASLPRVTGEWGYVTGVSLALQPRFVSAGCPAPAGFKGAVFPLMKTNFGFAGGLRLNTTVVRGCKVR